MIASTDIQVIMEETLEKKIKKLDLVPPPEICEKRKVSRYHPYQKKRKPEYKCIMCESLCLAVCLKNLGFKYQKVT